MKYRIQIQHPDGYSHSFTRTAATLPSLSCVERWLVQQGIELDVEHAHVLEAREGLNRYNAQPNTQYPLVIRVFPHVSEPYGKPVGRARLRVYGG